MKVDVCEITFGVGRPQACVANLKVVHLNRHYGLKSSQLWQQFDLIHTDWLISGGFRASAWGPFFLSAHHLKIFPTCSAQDMCSSGSALVLALRMQKQLSASVARLDCCMNQQASSNHRRMNLGLPHVSERICVYACLLLLHGRLLACLCEQASSNSRHQTSAWMRGHVCVSECLLIAGIRPAHELHDQRACPCELASSNCKNHTATWIMQISVVYSLLVDCITNKKLLSVLTRVFYLLILDYLCEQAYSTCWS